MWAKQTPAQLSEGQIGTISMAMCHYAMNFKSVCPVIPG